VQTIQNTANISTHITKTLTQYKTHTHTHTHTHPHVAKQVKTEYKIHQNEIVTIQSSIFSIRSPYCAW